MADTTVPRCIRGTVRPQPDATGVGVAGAASETTHSIMWNAAGSGLRPGADLGLALVNRFVELQDGWVEIESGNSKEACALPLPALHRRRSSAARIPPRDGVSAVLRPGSHLGARNSCVRGVLQSSALRQDQPFHAPRIIQPIARFCFTNWGGIDHEFGPQVRICTRRRCTITEPGYIWKPKQRFSHAARADASRLQQSETPPS